MAPHAPATPNTGRPKPPMRTQAQGSFAESESSTPPERQIDPALLRHIDAAIEQRFSGRCIDEAVERHFERLNISERVDARIDDAEVRRAVASSATQALIDEVLDAVEQKQRRSVSELISSRLAETEAELEERLHQRLQQRALADETARLDRLQPALERASDVAEQARKDVDTLQGQLAALERSLELLQPLHGKMTSAEIVLAELPPLHKRVEETLGLLERIDVRVRDVERAAAQLDGRHIMTLIEQRLSARDATVEALVEKEVRSRTSAIAAELLQPLERKVDRAAFESGLQPLHGKVAALEGLRGALDVGLRELHEKIAALDVRTQGQHERSLHEKADRTALDSEVLDLHGKIAALEGRAQEQQRRLLDRDAAEQRLTEKVTLLERDRGALEDPHGKIAALEERAQEQQRRQLDRDAAEQRLNEKVALLERDRGALDGELRQLHEKITALDAKAQSEQERQLDRDTMKESLHKITDRTALDSEIFTLHAKIAALEARTQEQQQRQLELDTTGRGLHEKVAAMEGRAALDCQVESLHEKIAALEARSQELQQRQLDLDATGKGLHEKVAAMKAESAALDSGVRPLHEKVAALEARIGEQQDRQSEADAAERRLHEKIAAMEASAGEVSEGARQQIEEIVGTLAHDILLRSAFQPGGRSRALGPAGASVGGELALGSTRESVSRPGTSPRPFSSGSLPLGAPQNKAVWTSGTYQSVAAVPTEDARALSHVGLEHDLIQKVVAREPNRHHMGVSEFVIRDVVNSVVREIVGVFESLLDRLLREKKHETIRHMVSEIIVDDLSATLATAHEQLKQKEIGHILSELARLRTDIRDGEAALEERLHGIKQLRDSQDDLWTAIDDRCCALEARAAIVETTCVPRTEQEEHLKAITNILEEMQNRVGRSEGIVFEWGEQVVDLRRHIENACATKSELTQADARLSSDAGASRDEALRLIQELREHAASNANHRELKASHEEAHKAQNTAMFKVQADIDSLNTRLAAAQRFCDDTFVTKYNYNEQALKVSKERGRLQATIESELQRLENLCCTKASLQELRVTVQSRSEELARSIEEAAAALGTATCRIGCLEDEGKSLATREYVYDVADKLSRQVASECDEKEDIAQLRRELDEERERIRQAVRQQHVIRQDLNGSVDELHQLTEAHNAVRSDFGDLRSRVDGIDMRVVSDWQWVQAAIAKQLQAHDALDASHKGLQDDFATHVSVQRRDAEQLKHQAMHRYVEQIDRALALNSKLAKVELEQGDLSEVVRGIKLPQVTR